MSTGFVWLGGYLFVAVVLAVLAYVYWTSRRIRGVGYLLAASLSGSVATVCYVMVLVAPDLPTKVLLWQVFAVLVLVVAACWYLFAVTWVERDRLAKGPALGPLAVGVALLVTNASPVYDGLHSLLWTDVSVAAAGATTSPLSVTTGPAAVLLSGYPAVLVAVTVGLLAAFTRQSGQRLYRWRNALVAVGAATALLFGVGLALLDTGYRPEPFAAVLGLGFAAVGLVRFGSYDLVSLPENSLIEAIDGGILVYNTDGRVVDFNSAAARVLGLSAETVGRGILAVLEVSEDLPSVRADGANADEVGDDPSAVADRLDGHEFTTTLGGESRTFAVRVSELDDDGTSLGWTVVLYDVTSLRRKQGELDLLKQVLSRVLRHNVRNDLSVVKTNAEALATDASGLEAERLRTIIDKSEDLLAASEKARTVEHLLDGDRERGAIDLASVARDAVDAVEPDYPAVEFRTSLPGSCEIQAHWALSTAVENLVENGAVHNDGDEPVVDVAVECDDETATLTVADNGPGIPYRELEVLDRREETQLEHGSSVGLWLVEWIVDLSGAAIDFENTDRGCTVTLTFDRATDDRSESIAEELGLGPNGE